MKTKRGTILFVGDPALMGPFVDKLRKENYFVERIGNKDEIESGLEISPSVALIQWADKEDWIGVITLRELRNKSPKLPVIAICDTDSEAARVAALNEGSDDVVELKNCSEAELIARIGALMRRANPSKKSSNIMCGEIVVEHDKRRVLKNERSINLGLMEYETLRLLLRNPGRVFDREALLRHLGKNVQERTVDVCIGRLRKALGDTKQNIIKTQKGVGYYACAPNC